jgi:hypothetical protein
MKVYSLYDKDQTFLGAFPSRDMCVCYAKVLHPNADGWDYDILEEYLVKSPIYSSPYTTLTPSQTIPCNPGITLMPGTPQINNSVRAE